MSAKHSVAEKICLTCGLCCNGVIFADVQLQRGDDAAKLESLGLRLLNMKKRVGISAAKSIAQKNCKFSQPCAAFDGCHCRIYENRPKYCRAFECALLKKVNVGTISPADALQIIEKARRRAEKVRQLLRKLGDKDETLALALRFRRTSKRVAQSDTDAQTARLFGELGLAFHELNVVLSEKFYP
jgi:Fe-S-cluster containining protein